MVTIPLKLYFKLKLIWEKPLTDGDMFYRIWIVFYLLKKEKKKEKQNIL